LTGVRISTSTPNATNAPASWTNAAKGLVLVEGSVSGPAIGGRATGATAATSVLLGTGVDVAAATPGVRVAVTVADGATDAVAEGATVNGGCVGGMMLGGMTTVWQVVEVKTSLMRVTVPSRAKARPSTVTPLASVIEV
jgi:hypothetical protein